MGNRSRNDDEGIDDYVNLEITPGPEPLPPRDEDPKFVRNPVGFVWPTPEIDPLLYEGDQA